MNAQTKLRMISLLLSLAMSQLINAAPIFGDADLSQRNASTSCSANSCRTFPKNNKRLDAHSSLIQKVNIFSETGVDPRVKASTLANARMYKPIGFLSVTSSSKKRIPWKKKINGKKRIVSVSNLSSTGFLISPCLVLTNYHAVFGRSKEPNIKDFPVTFTANRTVKATPIQWGPKDKSGTFGDDYAILELDKTDCLGLEVGWLELPLLNLSQALNTPMVCAGFPGSKNDTDGTIELWVDTNCDVMEFPSNARDLFLTKGSVTAGNSGGPVAYFDSDGIPHFIGIQTTEVKTYDGVLKKYEREYANVAVSITSIRNLDDLIEADLKWNQSPANPLASGITTPPNGK